MKAPDHMTPGELQAYLGSSLFAERSRAMRERVEAGEVMTMEGIAHDLGLPFAFFGLCLGLEIQRQHPGAFVVVDSSVGVMH